MELLAVPPNPPWGGAPKAFFSFQNFVYFFGPAGILSLQGERGLCLFILKDRTENSSFPRNTGHNFSQTTNRVQRKPVRRERVSIPSTTFLPSGWEGLFSVILFISFPGNTQIIFIFEFSGESLDHDETSYLAASFFSSSANK